jgi:hypothetical protein
MIGVAIAAVVVGLVLLFVMPWVGVPVAIVGALLFLGYFVAFVRRTGEHPRRAR